MPKFREEYREKIEKEDKREVVDDEKGPSKEDRMLVEKSAWMVRPCPVYDAEYKQCHGLRGRFYQYYIDGELANCKTWLNMMRDCRRWMNKDDIEAGARIIRLEKKRVNARIQSRLNNTVWTKREERPPPNWDSPLPSHITEKYEHSYLIEHMDELTQPFDEKPNSSCSIS